MSRGVFRNQNTLHLCVGCSKMLKEVATFTLVVDVFRCFACFIPFRTSGQLRKSSKVFGFVGEEKQVALIISDTSQFLLVPMFWLY